MNVVFLDYDGVVNTPMWLPDGSHCRYNFPEDNAVNNFQCVQWVSEFCEKYNYKIVVTSTWRMDENYIDCLKNGGLRDNVEVLGATPISASHNRGEEITMYLEQHPDIDKYLIFDDEDYSLGDYIDKLILCNPCNGFDFTKFSEAVQKEETI